MKEDAQLICPIAYEDKNEIWPVIQKFICDRLPLKDVTWRSSISSSFINIERLPLRFLPSSARLFNETQHPYRRFLAPYVHIYLLCAESMDVYKSSKAVVKKWMEPYKIGKQPWLVVYVPLGTSTMDVYNKVYARISNDFYIEKSGDHSVMLIIPPDGSRRSVSTQERTGHQYLFQQAYTALTDLLGKLRDGVVMSFQMRTTQYDADIRRLDIPRGTPNFDFWQLFLVKESLALMYQMLQLPDRALALYEELDALLPFAPYHSLPTSDWPMVVSTPSTPSVPYGSVASPNNPSGKNRSSSNVAADNADNELESSRAGADEGSGCSPSRSSTNSSRNIAAKKDLMSDACRCGEDIIAYSINQARMNILWNRLSFFQLQHYLFARQMYFLLVHLRQPTRCAEKALAYMRTASTQLEKHLRKVHATGPDSLPSTSLHSNTLDSAQESKFKGDKLLQLRLVQADVWALTSSLKLIRECRALLKLLVGGDETYQSMFNISSNTCSSGVVSSGLSCSQSSVPSATQDSFQDNLAAISSISTHGSSVVYSSLAELNRSQHGISNFSSTRRPNAQGQCGGTPGIPSPLSATGSALSPAAALREVLFSPDLDIDMEVRDSSRVLGELIEFALQRLQSLSSSTVKNPGQKALDLVLSVEPFTQKSLQEKAKLVTGEAVPKILASRGSSNVPSGEFAAAAKVTSPKNMELVLSIEQELSMLDESREVVGIAGVADRMDQILLSISQKVRSTSHFWAKLYEVSAPGYLFFPSCATESDREGQRGRVESNDSASSEGSPLGSRVVTPIGSPAPGPENFISRGTRKMLSRHSSRSLVMSESQLERGKLLELCLAVLGCSAQWHLQLLANRPRFALSAMLRCADLLLCNGQWAVAAKRLEEALRSGLLAPVAAYIGVDRLSWRSSEREIARCTVFQRCLADKQLHQQQEAQHHTLDFTASLASENTRAYPLHGSWVLLWHWTLRKLMYCMQETEQWTRYRAVLANLLIPTSVDGLTRFAFEPQSFLADVLERFVVLSAISPRRGASLTPEVPAEMKLAELNDSASLPLLRLPLNIFFDVKMGMVRPLKADALGSDPRLVQGFEVVREEWLPVSAMQCEGGREGGYCLPITLHSKLPGPLPVDSFFVVYKRFTADSIVTQTINAGESLEEDGTNVSLDQLLAVHEDEFVCRPSAAPAAESSGLQLSINPGSQSFFLAFQPTVLGEYRLDRIMIVVGTALFEAHMLPEVCLSSAQREYSQHQYQYAGPSESLAIREDIFSSPGLANLAPLDSLDVTHLADNSNVRVYSVGESAALTTLKTYFAQHSIINVLQPVDLLSVNAFAASCLPLFQSDDTYFTAETSAGDELEDLVVRVWGDNSDTDGTSKYYPISGEDSRSNSANISLSLSNEASTRIVGSRHISGFVPQDQATPAAMRRRRVDPIDEDEELAIANASAAVASLLAQQAEDSNRASRRRGSRDSAAEEDTELFVSETSEWKVVATNLANAVTVKPPFSFRNVTTSASDDQQHQRILSIGTVTAETRLHFRIPICVGKVDSNLLNQSTGGGDALLHFELTGRLCRAGCVIPVVLRKTLVVHATPMMDMQLHTHKTFPPCASTSSTDVEVLIQAELRNNTGDCLELIGFGASYPEGTALNLVDGPVNIPVLMNGVAVPIATTANFNVVSLFPADLYLAGLLLRYGTENRAICGTVDFYLQRSTQFLDGKVNSCIYRHNSFVVRRGLTLDMDKMLPSVSAASGARDILGGSDGYSSSFGCLRLHVKALPNVKYTQLGRLYTCTMLLSVGFAVAGNADPSCTAGVGYRYRSCSACVGDSSTSLADLAGNPVHALDVMLCETEDWVAVGHTRRVLTANALTPAGKVAQNETQHESCVKPTPTKVASNFSRERDCSSSALTTNWVEVQYELQWEILPVTLGRLTLPPLQVSYSLRPDQVHVPSSGAAELTIATLHPSKLDGSDVVDVLPVRPQQDSNYTGEEPRRENENVVVRTSFLASYCTL